MITRHSLAAAAFLALILANCASLPADFERTKVAVNGQVFRILTAHALFDDYLRHTDQRADIGVMSKNLLFDPLAREILDEKAQAPFMFGSVALPYEPNAFLKQEIQLLKASNVADSIEGVLPAINKSLPGSETKIVVLPASPVMKPYLDKFGVSGYGATLGSGRIVIAVDPTKPDWRAFLSYATAHEYHHSTWISRNWVSADFTLLEYVVFEGRADAFAKSMNPEFGIPADRYLTRGQESAVWRQIRPTLSQKGSNRINEVMNGSGGIPFGSGYAIGYHIVLAFKQRNPSSTDADLIDMDPRTILEKSGYDH